MTTFLPSAFAFAWQALSLSAQFTALVVARSADDATAFSAERFTRLRMLCADASAGRAKTSVANINLPNMVISDPVVGRVEARSCLPLTAYCSLRTAHCQSCRHFPQPVCQV